jgi:hypothetical protein
MALTVDQAKDYILKQIKDFRAPDKKGFETVKNWGEQQKREYADAKADAARTGSQADINRAKRLKEIVALYDDVVKSRDLTTKAQALYENIDSNRKKLESLKALGEGTTDEAKKLQRQLTRARAGLQDIETQRDAFGTDSDTANKNKAGKTLRADDGVDYVWKNNTLYKDGKPFTGTVPWADGSAKYKNGVEVTAPTGEKTGGTAGGATKDTAEVPAGQYPEKPKTPTATAGQKQEEALAVAGGEDFALPETIFKNVPSLNAILQKYVNGEIASTDGLRKAIRDDVWYKQNSAEIKNRYVQLFNYRDLVATGQATGNTAYEKQIADLERKLADKARAIGSNAASDPAALRRAAENMYITNVGIDDAMTVDFLASAIKPISSMIGGKPTLGYSGEALTNYKTLLQTARDNGFEISDILPGGANEQQVLAGIASGKIDINRVQQDARKLAAQGQPQYVRDLLAQGYDLAQVFAPYRKVMGTVLEVNPDQIDLNDPLLRTAITDKGDMNLYDFKKAMRADNRWQYTEQAKSDVSTAALNVLKDFGFQG